MTELIPRRQFLRSTAVVGTGMMISPRLFAAEAGPRSRDAIHVGLIGAGAQGQVLMDTVIKISKESPVLIRAVCDIWEPNRTRVSRTLNAYRALGHRGNAYVDYQEMLDRETDLDAVIVATPDFWHAEHAIAAINKGLHVYCEKEMSNTIEGARRIVLAAKQSGRLVQIGHQRRSNPRYLFCYRHIINQTRILGRITTVNGQWNRSRSACEDLGWPEGTELAEPILNKYGFASMHQFRNWRWYKGLGGGPIVDLGSHQIDIYNWFLGTAPRAVMASGGIDYWAQHQWYDNVIAVYEYQTDGGPVRAMYQTLTTNSNGGYFEQFMGDRATLDLSESGRSAVYRETWVPEKEWYQYEDLGLIKREEGLEQPQELKSILDVRSSPKPPKYNLLVEMNKPYHQPHLENFFEAIRGNEPLNCPAEVGFETAVTVLKVNEAIEAGRRLQFRPEDFVV